ncbi:MAG: hypothetical protein ACI4DK_12905 [Lachnospiraceae bacterium]
MTGEPTDEFIFNLQNRVEQLMRVGISDRAIAVQALVAMGVEVKE